MQPRLRFLAGQIAVAPPHLIARRGLRSTSSADARNCPFSVSLKQGGLLCNMSRSQPQPKQAVKSITNGLPGRFSESVTKNWVEQEIYRSQAIPVSVWQDLFEAV
eukprot:1232673-Rhodomonas_salina.1